ncbi:MAG: [Clostridia bacterium]|nr:[FeFe] hydrogenase H-cluster maturation GTPase HydF [Clostridia bacterium]
MNLNSLPSSERVHIGFFGLRNAGKSSLVNAVTGQSLSVVSDVKGTTTDPVKKSMELLPIGPVVIIDTPGIDDEGGLGELRVKKAKEMLSKTDVAILVTDAVKGLQKAEKDLIAVFEDKDIPYIVAFNKADLKENTDIGSKNEIAVSALTGKNINELKELIGSLVKAGGKSKPIVRDLIKSGDRVILVIPIDKSAPKGRLILPQQMTIREILDCGAVAITCRDTELSETLTCFNGAPKLIITDSQAFGRVSQIVPDNIPMTSFSILFARYKGELTELVKGASVLSELKDGDKVLISEGCTHHRQCNDIGTVKMPAWIKAFSNAKLNFDFTSGGEFPEDLSGYALVVHCGGCMINEKEMKSRIEKCVNSKVPIVNYGVAIAHIHGILKRSLEVFPGVLEILG